uniref:Uncharacterized protein n=1 Tax=Aegilops tauschii subsp. strangulata TaxID=200361 RepID=A0A453MBB2_AEGTS
KPRCWSSCGWMSRSSSSSSPQRAPLPTFKARQSQLCKDLEIWCGSSYHPWNLSLACSLV